MGTRYFIRVQNDWSLKLDILLHRAASLNLWLNGSTPLRVTLPSAYFNTTIVLHIGGACGGVVVKALHYQSDGPEIDFR